MVYNYLLPQSSKISHSGGFKYQNTSPKRAFHSKSKTLILKNQNKFEYPSLYLQKKLL